MFITLKFKSNLSKLLDLILSHFKYTITLQKWQNLSCVAAENLVSVCFQIWRHSHYKDSFAMNGPLLTLSDPLCWRTVLLLVLVTNFSKAKSLRIFHQRWRICPVPFSALCLIVTQGILGILQKILELLIPLNMQI
jgi:hypothetical protein